MNLLALMVSGLLVVSTGAVAQTQLKLVDPATVAPEHREAAAKRRAEQLKLQGCMAKADHEKILPRDRAQFVSHCLEAEHQKP